MPEKEPFNEFPEREAQEQKKGKKRKTEEKQRMLKLVTEFDSNSTYNMMYLKKLYGERKIYIIPQNTGYRDACLSGTLLPFLLKNINDTSEDTNFPFIKQLLALMDGIMGKEDWNNNFPDYEVLEEEESSSEEYLQRIGKNDFYVGEVTTKKGFFRRKKSKKVIQLTSNDSNSLEQETVKTQLQNISADEVSLEEKERTESRRQRQKREKREKKEAIRQYKENKRQASFSQAFTAEEPEEGTKQNKPQYVAPEYTSEKDLWLEEELEDNEGVEEYEKAEEYEGDLNPIEEEDIETDNMLEQENSLDKAENIEEEQEAVVIEKKPQTIEEYQDLINTRKKQAWEEAFAKREEEQKAKLQPLWSKGTTKSSTTETWICLNCGIENDGKFCKECGTKKERSR